MADRRIDQLTEAEDISDEDLFVIWKQNISQTRSIAKGTMNLATKSYVDNSKSPDWENAVAITASQLIAGYTCPSNGMIVGVAWKDDTATVTMLLKLNGVTIAGSRYTNSDWAFANVQISVEGGDVLRETGATALTSNISFVPYKA